MWACKPFTNARIVHHLAQRVVLKWPPRKRPVVACSVIDEVAGSCSQPGRRGISSMRVSDIATDNGNMSGEVPHVHRRGQQPHPDACRTVSPRTHG
jgi:hypothetical protein